MSKRQRSVELKVGDWIRDEWDRVGRIGNVHDDGDAEYIFVDAKGMYLNVVHVDRLAKVDRPDNWEQWETFSNPAT